MTLPSFLCRMPTLSSSSFITTPQNKRFQNSPVRSSGVGRKPLWSPVVRSSPASPRRPCPPRISARQSNGGRSNWKRLSAASAAPGFAFAITLSGVMGSTSLESCLQYMKALASGGGDGTNGLNPGDGGGGGGGQEFYTLAVNEDDDDDEDGEEDDEETSSDADLEGDEGEEAEDEEDVEEGFEEGEEDEEGFEEGEIEEYFDEDLDEEDYVDPTAPFECNSVTAVGLPSGPGVPRDVDLFAGINCQKGFRCTQEELRKDLKRLSNTEGVDHVEIRVTPVKGTKGKKCDVSFVFESVEYGEMKRFKTKGATAIPRDVVEQVMDTYQKDVKSGVCPKAITIQTLGLIRSIIEKWYQDRGYIMSYIRNFNGLGKGDVTAHVVEGRVKTVKVMFVDDEGNEKKRGNATPHSFIRRELSFVPGQLYNQEDSRRALRDLIATGLYENVQVRPEQSLRDARLVDVTVMVKERPMRTTEIELDWQVRRQNGIPLPESVVPGGTILIDHRNLLGQGNNLTGTVTTSNLFDPRDIGYKIELKRPYIFGEKDPKKTALSGIVFNSRRISSVFTPGPTGEEVPYVFVHRSGARVSLNEQYTCNSRGSLGMVMQEIMTYDDSGTIISRGFRNSSQNDGPPTTLGEGQDQQVYVQANLVRDTTYSVNGSPVGARDMYLVDQGTGIGGFFNRQVISLTRFLKLMESPGARSPKVLVLHGRFGNTFGDLASYDAFPLGGPHSVRGVNLGELGTCRRFLEAAAELRWPTPLINQQMYAFVEYGTDLNSSEEVPGNPTVYFRKPGSGATWGGGMKVGPARIEYSRDLNLGRGSLMLNIGERF